MEIWRQSARFDPALGSPLSWLMTIAHRRAVDRVRSAEATSRRDTSYHQQNQVTEHDSTAEAATQNLEARRVRQALAQPHRHPARRAGARLLRWLHPQRGGHHARHTRWALPRPGSGTDSSGSATRWESTHERHAPSVRCLRRRRPRRPRARPLRAPPRRVPRLRRRGRQPPRGRGDARPLRRHRPQCRAACRRCSPRSRPSARCPRGPRPQEVVRRHCPSISSAGGGGGRRCRRGHRRRGRPPGIPGTATSPGSRRSPPR